MNQNSIKAQTITMNRKLNPICLSIKIQGSPQETSS